ncbi:MAG TPA: MFS transporter [Clostridiales bacterium]|nr:MFS transporter [Clostridiales bacterium]
MNKVRQKAVSAVNTLAVHWKTPPLGKYVSYREILMYGFGGMGVQFVLFFSNQIALTATSFLVGNTIGIKPMHLQYMAIVSTIAGFGITVMRSYLIDSVKMKMGKFRPWLATMGFPTLVISFVFVWLPYDTMPYARKAISVLICFVLLQCFSPFFSQSFFDLVNVMSPNSHERTDIVAISSIIYSFAPSLTGAFVPMLSTLTGGLNNISTYRVIHPAIAVIGLALSFLAVKGTRERIVVARTHVSHFKFSDALRCVAKNKYFWITSLAGWLGFLEGAVGVIIGWTFIYGYPNRMGTYGLATSLIGNAALWAMLLSPYAIRTLGKRNLLIWYNVANIVLISAFYPFYRNIYALIALYFLNGFVGSFSVVYGPGINADMRDYQQYFTGERIDGMFGAVGIIGSFVGIFTGMVLPTIYQRLGLQDNYDVLEVASFREEMFSVLIIAAVIGAALNCVPYFFYDLTEVKQRGIVKVLKIRALFEDYGNGVLRDSALVEAIDIIDEAKRLQADRHLVTTADDVKAARRLPASTETEKQFRAEEIARVKAARRRYLQQRRQSAVSRRKQAAALPRSERKAALKAARAENHKSRKYDDDVSVCDFVINEMEKFSSPRVMAQVERAERTVSLGIEGLRNTNPGERKAAKALPKRTAEERSIRSDALAYSRAKKSCRKLLLKYYPDKVTAPADRELEEAEALPADTLPQRLRRHRAIRRFVSEKSRYTRAVKVLLDAERLLTEMENYRHLEEIRLLYDEAKARHSEESRLKQQEIEKLEAARKEEILRRNRERLSKWDGAGKPAKSERKAFRTRSGNIGAENDPETLDKGQAKSDDRDGKNGNGQEGPDIQ